MLLDDAEGEDGRWGGCAMRAGGDDIPDVVIDNYTDFDLGLFRGVGDGTFLPMERFGAGLRQPVLVELDGDGKLDLIARSGGSIRLFLGDGDGGFVFLENHSVLPNVFGVDVADLNGDGLVDIFVHDEGVNSLWKVLLGEPGPTWNNSVPRVDPGFTFYDSELADIDGDGRVDLITHDSAAGVAVWLPGGGDGTFAGRVAITRDGLPDSFGAGYNAVDLEGDGDVDLVFGTSNDLLVVTNAGGGHFSEPARLRFQGAPNQSIQVADIDRDGRVDVTWVLVNDNEMGIAFGQTAARAGTKFERSLLPSCPTGTLSAQDVDRVASFALLPDSPCRVDRLALEPSAPLAAATVLSPAGRAAFSPPGQVRWSGSNVPALARFQGSAARGTWAVTVSAPLDGLDLIVNQYPADPFALPAPACSAQVDPSDDAEAVCVLDDTLAGLVTSDTDEDIFLLRGQLGGGFAVGELAAVHVTSDRPVEVQIRALGATAPLVWASGVTDELVELVVPVTYHGRYLAVHVVGAGAQPATYSLTP